MIKAAGAFIEYTMKPIIEDIHELFDRCEKLGIHPKESLVPAVILYLFDKATDVFNSVLIVGMICYTALEISRSLP